MNRQIIEKMMGETWIDFMSPFCESLEMDTILGKLKEEKTAGKIIYPINQQNIFRCFKETPLSEVRVVIVGQDPYPKGFSSGLAFGVDIPGVPPSLAKIIDAVEVDCYSGLNFNKPDFDRSLVSWAKQGVLLMNAGLTLPASIETDDQGNQKEVAGSHIELWAPFTNYVIEKLKIVKKNVIYLGWGSIARDVLKGVNTFFDYMPPACEHPSAAARGQRSWDCKHFSTTNAIITANKLGEPIKW